MTPLKPMRSIDKRRLEKGGPVILTRRTASVLGSLLLATAVVAVALVLAASASGAEPLIVTGSFSGPPDTSSGLCGFPLTLNFVGTFEVKLFVDEQGTVVRATLHENDVATATNPANGKTLTGHEVLNIQKDVLGATEATMGLGLHFNVTGGSALVDAGKIVINQAGDVLFIAGNHEFLEGDLAACCAALA